MVSDFALEYYFVHEASSKLVSFFSRTSSPREHALGRRSKISTPYIIFYQTLLDTCSLWPTKKSKLSRPALGARAIMILKA